MDKTLLEQVISSVPTEMIDEVVVAGGYKVDMIKSYFTQSDFDFDITIVPEDKPLGTGGALGNCRDVVSGTFACFNGDVISSLDIKSLLSLHRTNGGIGTLGLWEVKDPTRFGIVGLDNNSKITRFMEKPKPEEVFSNLINAGSYIFEDDIFDYIPKGKRSIERDVFPEIAKSGKMAGLEFKGYFVDAGTPSSFIEATQVCISNNRFNKGESNEGNWFFDSNFITSSQISGSSISSGVSIGNDCEIIDCVILSGATIGDGCKLTRCLIGESSKINNNSDISDKVVGHGEIV